MTIRRYTPETMAAPAANYTHVAEVPAGTKLVFLSGQLGIAPGGTIPDDAESQTDIAFQNIEKGLAAAGMTMADIIRINAMVTDRAYLKPYMAVRDRWVADPPPASTLIIVAGFANPAFKVEIEVIAGRADAAA